MKCKTLDDFLYAGHMVKSYIDGYGKGSTPPTPPTPSYKTWGELSAITWGEASAYKWGELGQTA
jgi:hypothetical protein